MKDTKKKSSENQKTLAVEIKWRLSEKLAEKEKRKHE